MKVLAVGNEKGGTGKSAIATQMAFYAAEEGARVLLVDLDPQATCTFNFVDAVPDEALTSLHLFGATAPLSRSPCKTHAAAIDLVPATRLLDAVPENARHSPTNARRRIGANLRATTS